MYICYAMNANGIEILCLVLVAFQVFRWCARRPTTHAGKISDARLQRIQIVSGWVQGLVGLGFLIGVNWLLAFLFGWPFFSQGQARVVISHSHIYTSPAEMPAAILIWWSVKMGLAFFCYGVLFSLFRRFKQGILFSAKNIRHIHALAYFLIGNWVIDYLLQSTLQDMDLSSTPLFVGLLIIFIAWIMDEGRKIQEEQELTV
jgi:Protein of unknown function (DUF2975)